MSEPHSLEQRIRDGLLLDAYGSLLTEKQRLSCEMIWNLDYSLAEAADRLKVSRQGIHDLITRSRENMENYEKSLSLLERQNKIGKIKELVEQYEAQLPKEFLKSLDELIG